MRVTAIKTNGEHGVNASINKFMYNILKAISIKSNLYRANANRRKQYPIDLFVCVNVFLSHRKIEMPATCFLHKTFKAWYSSFLIYFESNRKNGFMA